MNKGLHLIKNYSDFLRQKGDITWKVDLLLHKNRKLPQMEFTYKVFWQRFIF